MSFMKDRHFSLRQDTDDLLARFGEAPRRDILAVLEAGGYFVAFLTRALLESPYDQEELQIALRVAPEQILPVVVERIEDKR